MFANIACVVVLSSILALLCTSIVPEKHVGLFYRFGALSNMSHKNPGLYLHMSWEKLENVQHTCQTDEVKNIAVVTADGIPIVYPVIQVVNRFANLTFVKNVIKSYGHLRPSARV